MWENLYNWKYMCIEWFAKSFWWIEKFKYGRHVPLSNKLIIRVVVKRTCTTIFSRVEMCTQSRFFFPSFRQSVCQVNAACSPYRLPDMHFAQQINRCFCVTCTALPLFTFSQKRSFTECIPLVWWVGCSEWSSLIHHLFA